MCCSVCVCVTLCVCDSFTLLLSLSLSLFLGVGVGGGEVFRVTLYLLQVKIQEITLVSFLHFLSVTVCLSVFLPISFPLLSQSAVLCSITVVLSLHFRAARKEFYAIYQAPKESIKDAISAVTSSGVL